MVSVQCLMRGKNIISVEVMRFDILVVAVVFHCEMRYIVIV